MHQPVHPHSQNPDRTSDGEETAATEPPTGPFSASAENGYRPTSRVSVPNPYTTRNVEVDDVDTGANQVGQWRGVGLDEPEPRSPHIPATTDTMTDTPFSPEHTERPEAPVSPPAPAAPEPAADHRSAPGQHTAQEPHRAEAPGIAANTSEAHGGPPQRPEALPEPRWPAAESAAPGRQWAPSQAPYDSQRYAQQPQAPYEPPRPAPAHPQGSERGQDQQPAGYDPYAPRGHQGHPDQNGYREPQGYQGPGHQDSGYQEAGYQDSGYRDQGYRETPGHQGPRDPRGNQGAPGYQDPQGYQGAQRRPDYQGHHEPAPHGYQRPPHEGRPPAPYPYPQAEYPPQPAPHYPVPYAHPHPHPHPLPYQSAYPLPYQPPGYVLPGQPMAYPGQIAPYGQFNPYGQPVQHVIVLTAGQQPQVVTAESAATLFAERTEPTVSQEVRQDKALTRSGTETEEESAAEPAREQEEARTGTGPGTQTTAGPSEQDTAQRETARPQAAQRENGTSGSPDAAGGATEGTAAREAARAEVAQAVSEALRGSEGDLLNEALAGLAMRDLSLVDALLEMVEELETDAQDPDLLDKLFQIDNFATRMRRNGENFLVLTGHDGGESDAHDEIVPLLDVARAATSEIKDYPRVSLGKLPQTSITGLAADDISHLLAELLDNATANSPEHSQVVISAQEMDDGRLMIVVEDEGVGIPDAQLSELNNRLNGEPVLDDEVPKHMGLYVASRIAQKHGLETRLESRSFRGVSAYTIIPKGLLRVATPRQPGQSRTSTIPSASAPVTTTGPIPQQSTNGQGANGSGGPKASPPPQTGGNSAVTSAGLPRRSATPHGSPLRMMPHPGALSENPPSSPKGREDTPPKLTGEARAEQIRDEIGDFLDGERAALEGEELEGDKE
nr:sensor histidine kinase [Nocardiopsis ganjiahuensis]